MEAAMTPTTQEITERLERARPSAPHRGPAVEVRDVVKLYRTGDGGTLRAVDGVSFEVRRGEVFGLLGPNGASKTTTLEIIEGLRTRDGGEVAVCGFDPQRA